MRCILFLVCCVAFSGQFALAGKSLPTYKMCVPHIIYPACQELMNTPNQADAIVRCVSARDRMACIEMVKRREADFMAVDPEDMYVAYHLNNQDFSVFSEIRTLEEPEAEFRYEGVILVRKSTNIRTLADLKGKKSCHTGFGRNVGYKIPITKLKKHGVFKPSTDATMSPVEKELKGLSDLFEKSCLVGSYSPNVEVNSLLKKRYPNLCALCEHPDKCDYPDRFSGYDGAIRCLVENGGDIAFTKVIYVRKYFGLPIGNAVATTQPSANIGDFEYLCEDGSRRAINGQACSWAQRPWQGYMGNADVNQKLEKLQKRIKTFYNDGKQSPNEEAAKKMWINAKNLVVSKSVPVLPEQHLVRAQYKDVIERDGSMEQKIRLCFTTPAAIRKCETMREAAYSRDIRPEFKCIQKTLAACMTAVKDGQADAMVLVASQYEVADKEDMKPIMYEQYGEKDVMVAIADKGLKQDLIARGNMKFNNERRAKDAALFFNNRRQRNSCAPPLTSDPNAPIAIVNAQELSKYANKELICSDLTRKPITDYATCNIETTLPTAVFVRKSSAGNELDNIMHAFTALSDKFGHDGKIEDVFELFGKYEDKGVNIMFSDRAEKLSATGSNVPTTASRKLYREFQTCP